MARLDLTLPKTAGPSATPKFSSQQLRSIKQAPKGKLPKFMENNIGTYSEPGIRSIGGAVNTPVGRVGGTLGLDAKSKKGTIQPFGSWNVNGQIKGEFGPQGEGVPMRKMKRVTRDIPRAQYKGR